MTNERLKAPHSNGLGDVAEWLRSGLQIRAKTQRKQRADRETIHPNTRERIVILGNRFAMMAGCAHPCCFDHRNGVHGLALSLGDNRPLPSPTEGAEL